jgi:hypothetical protein
LTQRINAGPSINVGIGLIGKNNEGTALNKHRKLENICSPWKKIK